MTAGDFLLLLCAGVGSGLVGTVAGLASLVSYPALLLVGLGPVEATVTNTVALIGSGVGAIHGSRGELRATGRTLRWAVPAAMAGATGGAALLMATPATSFASMVPVLIGLSSLTILIPRTSRASRASRQGDAAKGPAGALPRGLIPGVLLISAYSGFFGSAAGVLMLALLLRTDSAPLAQVNAVKNVLICAANVISAILFAFIAPVHWGLVIPLGIGCLVGGRLGPLIVRRAEPGLLRIGIACAGLALAAYLAS